MPEFNAKRSKVTSRDKLMSHVNKCITMKYRHNQQSAQSNARPVLRRSRVRSSRPATFFCGDWSRNNFYGHSLPSADSRRAVVSYWRKNVHEVPLSTGKLPRRLAQEVSKAIKQQISSQLVHTWVVTVNRRIGSAD